MPKMSGPATPRLSTGVSMRVRQMRGTMSDDLAQVAGVDKSDINDENLGAVHDANEGAAKVQQAGGDPSQMSVSDLKQTATGEPDSSSPEDQTKQQLIAKALLAFVPVAVGAALGGAQGGAVGAEAGLTGLKSAAESEAAQKASQSERERFQYAKGEREKASQFQQKQFGEEVRHHASLEEMEKQKLAQNYELQSLKLAQAEGGKPLAAEQADKLAGHDSAMKTLLDLKNSVAQYQTNFGPVAGRILGANPYDPITKGLIAQTKTAAQNIGKSLEGGKLTDQDILRYERMLPAISDDPKTAQMKIELLQRMVAQKRASDLSVYGDAGYNVKHFAAVPVPETALQKGVGADDRMINFGGGGSEAQAAPPPPDFHSMSTEDLKKYIGGGK